MSTESGSFQKVLLSSGSLLKIGIWFTVLISKVSAKPLWGLLYGERRLFKSTGGFNSLVSCVCHSCSHPTELTTITLFLDYYFQCDISINGNSRISRYRNSTYPKLNSPSLPECAYLSQWHHLSICFLGTRNPGRKARPLASPSLTYNFQIITKKTSTSKYFPNMNISFYHHHRCHFSPGLLQLPDSSSPHLSLPYDPQATEKPKRSLENSNLITSPIQWFFNTLDKI